MTSMQDKLKGRLSHILPSDAQRMLLVELSKIRPNPDQPRKYFDEESLKELAQSINDYGQLQPIILKFGDEPDTYILVAGERRYRAHQILGKQEIYAVLTDGGLDEVGLIENIQREDLHPLELAESLQRLMEKHGWNQERLAEAIGKNRRTINEALKLNTLPDDIKDECRALGTEISKIALLQIARIDDPLQQRDFWVRVKNGNFTTREIQAHRKSSVAPKTSPSPTRKVLSIGKGFANKLRALSPQDVNDEEYYDLLKLTREITMLVEDINMQRQQ
jgi:ParB family transcriptional regulator, chromosome partitioning protein